MIKVGITGGIGSGKTVVAELFRLHAIPVYDADMQAKLLNDTSETIREKIILRFGNDLYADGRLDRKRFAEIIFQDQNLLREANSIIHPELRKHFLRWLQERREAPLVAIDAAVLFESNFHKLTDYNITVTAPETLRLRRATARDNSRSEQVKNRMESQMADAERIRLSDFVIVNDNANSLIKQIEEILSEIGRRKNK